MTAHSTPFSAENLSGDERNDALLSELGLDGFERAMKFDAGVIRRKTPDRCTWEIARPGAPSVFLKQYFPCLRVPWRSPHRQMSLEREAFSLLGSKGLPIPRLLAWGSRRGKGAYLIWEGCRGEPLDDVLQAGYPDPGKRGEFFAKRALIAAIAKLVRRLHDLRLVHRDLYLCHLLYAGLDAQEPKLFLIDLQRVTRKRLQRWYVKDLAALLSSAPRVVSRADALRFFLLWKGKRRVDESSRRWIRAIVAKVKKIRAHRPKHG